MTDGVNIWPKMFIRYEKIHFDSNPDFHFIPYEFLL